MFGYSSHRLEFHLSNSNGADAWRVSSLTLLGLLAFYLLAVAFGTAMAKRLAKFLFDNNEETTILGLASLLQRWIVIWIHLSVVAMYAFAQSYIILEGFASIDWSNSMPHF